MAAQTKTISAVALLGFNPFGRYEEFIRRERRKLHSGSISGAEYRNNLAELYAQWAEICSSPEDIEKEHNAWTSFSIDYTPFLLQIDVPVFVGYGTEDIIAENCDLLPLEFISSGKDNLTLKPYPGLEHNFYEMENGNPNYQGGGHFHLVIDDILSWREELLPKQ